MLGDIGASQVSDISYSIWPTIALDKVTSQLRLKSTYRLGFTFYQHTSSLNQVDQNVVLDLQHRLSPHLAASLRDVFRKTSNVSNQLNPLSGGAISGTAQARPFAVIVPTADQLNNAANLELTYQFSRNGMIGAGGAFTNLHYLDPAEIPGL